MEVQFKEEVVAFYTNGIDEMTEDYISLSITSRIDYDTLKVK